MRHVLIVDDNADTREIYEHCSTEDVHLTTVPDGASCLQLVDEKPFDAVLLDLSMHPLDGLAVAQEIRRNEETHSNKKPVHLAFFTARVIDEEVQEVAAETNVEMIFQKPCDPTVLVERINLWLNKAQYIQGRRHIKPPQNGQKGAASTNWMIVLIAIIVQIVVASLFLWLLNKQDVEAAYRWAAMKNQRDHLKRICDSNLLLDSQKEVFIKQNNLVLPAHLSGQTPCQAVSEQEK